MPAPSLTPEADALIDTMPAWASEFDRTFANHAPMVLTALARIGGTPARMRAFFNHYRDAKSLRPFPEPKASLDARSWEHAIGDRSREPDLRLFFEGEVAHLGRDGALRAYLPRLAPGVAASAFHALMRAAYGVLRTSDGDVAIALGYWAATYLALPEATGAAPLTDDPAEVLIRAARIEGLSDLTLHPLLWQNMRDAAAVPGFAPVVDWLAIDEATMARMAQTGLALFAATQHFAALHVVTGLHWIRLLSPFMSPSTQGSILRHFWQAIAALLPELGFPSLPDADTVARWRAIPAPDWREIHVVAAESYDEHDISLAFSAHAEMSRYGDPLYRVVTARRLGLIGDYRA